MHTHESGTKLVLIGAGSAVFTKGLVADMIQTTDWGPWRLGLVDIDPEALLADGAVTDRGPAWALAGDLLEAQRAYLPNFFGT